MKKTTTVVVAKKPAKVKCPKCGWTGSMPADKKCPKCGAKLK